MSCSSPRFAQSIARSPKISRRTGDLARTCVWKARRDASAPTSTRRTCAATRFCICERTPTCPTPRAIHDRHYLGIPYGFVFLDLSAALGEDWSVTFSHEALELTADPEANLLVRGPHPVERQR